MNVYDIPLYSRSEIECKFSRMPYAERIKMIENQVIEKFPDFNNIYEYIPLKENERITMMIGPECKLQIPTGMWISVLHSPSMGEYVELVKYRNDAPVLILGGFGTEIKTVRGMQADIKSLFSAL